VCRQVEDVAVRLTERDMATFTEHPIRDALYLVACKHCSAVVKDSAFKAHMDAAHGGPEAQSGGRKLLLNLQRLAQAQSPSPALKAKKKPPRDRDRDRDKPIPLAPVLAPPPAPAAYPAPPVTLDPGPAPAHAPSPQAPRASPKKGLVAGKSAGPNLDTICGVETTGVGADGQPTASVCQRSITCKMHTLTAKRGVAGRSKPLAELLRAFNINIKDIPPKKPKARAPENRPPPKPPLPVFKPIALPFLTPDPPRPLAVTTFGARRFVCRRYACPHQTAVLFQQ
jgi:SAGA-associated factor 73